MGRSQTMAVTTTNAIAPQIINERRHRVPGSARALACTFRRPRRNTLRAFDTTGSRGSKSSRWRAREGVCAPQTGQSLETTHKLEGDSPEKRLSYIGSTCVAGQRNVPAVV